MSMLQHSRRIGGSAALLALLLACPGTAGPNAAQFQRVQVGGQLCFVATPAAFHEPKTAMVLFHGNSHVVEKDTSSWESDPSMRRFMQKALDAGMLVAQSNAAGTRSNGMWGNPASQQADLALMQYLRSRYGIARFSAVSTSAGSLPILDLLLDGKASFASVAVFAPVVSLASMYRCPSGADRVRGLAEAFHFLPLRGCPGDPEKDAAFQKATAHYDPFRRMSNSRETWTPKAPWIILYNDHDPKVPPQENAVALARLLRERGIPVEVRHLDESTHNSDDLMDRFGEEAVAAARSSVTPATHRDR